jgi:alpha-beta hydrolase superfamily lysophospholipase
MQIKELNFQSRGDVNLFACHCTPTTDQRALVVITHGHGEHAGRYMHVAEALVERGIAVVAMDLRGHGRSEGARGKLMDWDELREDMRRILEVLGEDYDSVPKFLYGHSVGGTISLDYVIRNPTIFHGVIASAPSIGQPNIPAYLFAISRVVSVIYPSFSMATQLDQTALSRDPDVVEAYRNDPLVHSRGTARFGTELLKTAEWIQAHAADLKTPLFIVHGSEDRLINPEYSRRFFENVRIEDKTFLELPTGYHEPHNDLDKDLVIRRVGDWIEAHL